MAVARPGTTGRGGARWSGAAIGIPSQAPRRLQLLLDFYFGKQRCEEVVRAFASVHAAETLALSLERMLIRQ